MAFTWEGHAGATVRVGAGAEVALQGGDGVAAHLHAGNDQWRCPGWRRGGRACRTRSWTTTMIGRGEGYENAVGLETVRGVAGETAVNVRIRLHGLGRV